MSRRLFLAIIVAFGVAAVVFFTLGRSFMPADNSQQRTTQGKVNIGGPFQLVDGTGKAVSDMDFRGKYMILYFGYTFCPDVCPTSLGEISDTLDLLSPDEVNKVAPVFISVDPERDTPEVVGEYVTHFHDRIVGLTGSLNAVTAVAKSYKAYFSKGEVDEDGNYPVDHTSYTYVVGPDGQFITAYRHATPAADMAKSLKNIFLEE
ncbi:MAG: SCO family protein [Rhodospirillaceae bacterium]|nr:SCO family protein [Rhodospirillaceae bacterium]